MHTKHLNVQLHKETLISKLNLTRQPRPWAAWFFIFFVILGWQQPKFSEFFSVKKAEADNTSALTAGANSAVTSGAGDNNGFETTPTNTTSLNSAFASSASTGTNNVVDGCATFNQSEDDAHNFYNFGIAPAAGSSIDGIVVDTNGKWSTNTGTNQFCVALSWDGGASWTSAKGTGDLQTSAKSVALGGSADTWGRTWSVTELNDTNFRLRVMIDPGASNTTTAYLDYLAVTVYYTPPTTNLADGTNPGDSAVAPESGAADLDAFTLATSATTDTVTAFTVTLSDNSGIGQLDITDSGNTAVCTGVTDPSGTSVNFSGCNISVTTSPATYKIRLTPKSHANMPVVPGGAYAITGTITAVVGNNSITGTDGASATVTIDNLSPGDASNASTTPDTGQLTVSWNNPADSDFSEAVVLRNTASITDVPVEGQSYSSGDSINSSVVKYAGSGNSFVDNSVSSGTTYFYKIFAKDSSGNYSSAGVETSGSPLVGPAMITFSGTIFQSNGMDVLLAENPIKLAVSSSTVYSATTSPADGSFIFSNITQPASGTVVTIWLDTNGGSQASLVSKYGADCVGYPDCTGIKLFENKVRLNSRDGSQITNANLSFCDNDSGSVCSDTDIGFTSNSGTLTVTFPDARLRIAQAATFSPGGNVNAGAIEVLGSYEGGTETLTLSGSGRSFNCAGSLSIPLCLSGGSFAAGNNTVAFTGGEDLIVPPGDYYNLALTPTSSPVYSLGGGNWYNSAWSFRKPISINHNMVASSTGEAYNNFPVLISLASDLNLASSSQASANDILFTADDGTTKLNHEIEAYDTSNGKLIAWVSLPSLSTSTDTTLYMYYGNPAATDQSDKTAVWDSNYAGVYHLKDNSGSLDLSDSTSNANNGSNGGAVLTSGQAGGAASFDGSSKITLTSLGGFASAAYQGYTLEAWVKTSSTTPTQTIFDSLDNNGTANRIGLNVASIGISSFYNSTNLQSHNNGVNIIDGQWHQVATTPNPESQVIKIYTDGALSSASVGTTTAFSNFSGAATISSLSSNPMVGSIDELRISKIARSADWVVTGYNNQSATSSFYSLGPEQSEGFTVANNLTIGSGSPTVSPANGTLSIGAALSVNSGTLDLNSNDPLVSVSGNVSNSGTLNASDLGVLVLAGNFDNQGTFNANGGEVVFNPVSLAIISGGSTSFYKVTATSSGITLKFAAQSGNSPVFTFDGPVQISGTPGNNITIQSDSPGTQWLASFTGPSPELTDVSIADSGCGPNSIALNLPSSAVNLGNNGDCWRFYVNPSGSGNWTVVDPGLATQPVGAPAGDGPVQSGGDPAGDVNGGSTDPIGTGSGGGTTQSGGDEGSGGGSTASP